MSVVAIAPRRWKKLPLIKRAWLRWTIGLGAAVYLILALGTTEVNWVRVWEGLPRGARFFAAFFPPDFTSRWSEIAEGILERLWMTVVSTVIGIAISIPVGIGAAKNIAPAPIYYFCRGILAVSRSFQEIILAIFFVKLFGFGPFAGVVTLSFATIGFYGKLLAEDIEDMDPSQAEAVRATGAGWLQWLNYGVQPQVMPRMIGLGLYRFDINFRESAVVGIVGGGGIGATLNTAFDRYEFDSAAAILLIIIGIVMLVEYSSGYFAAVCSDGDRASARNEGVASPRARRAVRDVGGVARGRGDLHLLLGIDLRQDDLGLRRRRADAGGRSRRAHGTAGLGLHPRTVAPAMGHHQHRDAGHRDGNHPGGAGGLLCGAQHHVECGIHPAGGAVHHRVVALDQLADLGVDAGHDHRAGRVCRHPGDRAALNRLLRQAALRSDRGDRREPSRGGARDWRERRAGHGVQHRAASPAGVRRHFGVPLGHQHPRVDGAGPGGRRRHRAATQRRDHHARLDPGVAHSADHHRNRCGQRMGFGQGAPRDHLRSCARWRP